MSLKLLLTQPSSIDLLTWGSQTDPSWPESTAEGAMLFWGICHHVSRLHCCVLCVCGCQAIPTKNRTYRLFPFKKAQQLQQNCFPTRGISSPPQQIPSSLISLQYIPYLTDKTVSLSLAGRWNNLTCLFSNSTWNRKCHATRGNLLYFKTVLVLSCILKEVKQMKQILLTTPDETDICFDNSKA